MVTRRGLLAGAGTSLSFLGGCTSLVTTTDAEPPVVDDRPSTVYIPSHVDSVVQVGQASAGDVTVTLTYTTPRRRWTVDERGQGFEATPAPPDDDDTVYLAVSVFESETGVVVPTTGVELAVSTVDGDVTDTVASPTLSQQLGFHYGANVALDGAERYDVRATVERTAVTLFGALSGRLRDATTVRIPFDYRTTSQTAVRTTRFGATRRGQQDAVAPVSPETAPVTRVPASVEGRALGTGRLDDLVLRGTLVDADRFGDDSYLAVTAATPYNRFAVPGVTLTAEVPGEDSLAFAGRLRPALDAELGVHYGAEVSGEPSTPVTVSVEQPPRQVRLEGYETAFLSRDTVTLSR